VTNRYHTPLGFVFAIARTWKTMEEQSLKNLVTHVPHKYYQCTRFPEGMAGKAARRFGRRARACVCVMSGCHLGTEEKRA